MARIFDRFVSKILAVIVIVLFVAGFRDLLADKDFYLAFGGLMSTLPFAKVITDIVCKLMQYSESVPAITAGSFWGDVYKLAIMATLQPFVVGLLSALFLRVPGNTPEEREAYMETAPYKLKSLAISVITAPLLALGSAYLVDALSAYIAARYGGFAAALASFAAAAALIGLSLVPLLLRQTCLATALLWRLAVTLLGGMAKSYMTNALCLALYVALLGGVPSQILALFLTLVIWLIVADLALQQLRFVVAGTNLH